MNRYVHFVMLVIPATLLAQAPPPPGNLKSESFTGGRAVNAKTSKTSEPGQPPSITYGSTRESAHWVTDKRGFQVAVDDGIEWQGKKAYLTLTFDLLVEDAKAKKVLWNASVGAYWDSMTFKNVAQPGQPEKWAVVLSSSRKPGFEQPFELDTGKKLPLRGEPAAPDGKPVTPRKVWSGSGGISNNKNYQLISSAEAWTKLRSELFGNSPKIPDAADIDFSKETLLVCYAGKASNWSGIDVDLAVENDKRLLIRLHRKTYQSMGKTPDEYPFCLVVLPKHEGKEVVLEYNRQNLIGGPANWQPYIRLQ